MAFRVYGQDSLRYHCGPRVRVPVAHPRHEKQQLGVAETSQHGIDGEHAGQRARFRGLPIDNTLQQSQQAGRVVELQGERDGLAVVAPVDVVLQQLLLFDTRDGLGRAGGDGCGRSVLPKRDGTVAAAGDKRVSGGIDGQGPDPVGVVVERGRCFACVGVPDLDEAVAACAGNLQRVFG